ncbi:glycoside hydrolase family 32 protein [Actinoplanes subtropicus]|uniref:glycoside hydrolase family 32 protein n=1 Tax=Actinoplanes subtropicus TaxID=543632 RepID=UPI0004C2D4DC|nr:glycoside hydrolase family 32 protein [Actinoplanes subtropicus]
MRTALFAAAVLLLPSVPAPAVAAAATTTSYRAVYHNTVPGYWMNDPQRPVYLNGQFQYYYLYNDDYPATDHTSWRRATSTDLVHFTDQGVAVPKDTTVNGSIWSGSPVVDTAGTAGFGKNAVVALATQLDATNNAQAQFLWYSTDGGASFRPYGTAPVIPNPGRADFRDPKIIWDAARSRWVAVLAENDRLGFYTSTNLKTWQSVGEWVMPGYGVLECPDLFAITAGDGTTKWVLAASANGKAIGQPNTYAYWTGTFTGSGFQPDNAAPQWLDHGWDWYAAVTWENPAKPKTSRYAIGWMNDWDYAANTPTWANDGFNGTDSVVREIQLEHQADGSYSLVSQPVAGLDSLATSTTDLGTVQVNGNVPLSYSGDAYELTADVSWTQLDNVGLQLRRSADGTRHADTGVYHDYAYLNRGNTGNPDTSGRYLESRTPVDPGRKNVKLRILVDRTTAEVFLDDGRYVHSSEVFAPAGDNGIALYTDGGSATFSNLTIKTLGPISTPATPTGTVLGDFENGSYGGWTSTGTAFGTAPATGTLPGQQLVSGYLGSGLVDSYLGGDAGTGTLTSPAFTISRRYLKFLLGGGNHPNSAGNATTVNLIVGNQIARTATGRNEEYLRWTTWDLADLRGRSARIELIDNNTGSWGHLNADQFLLTTSP